MECIAIKKSNIEMFDKKTINNCLTSSYGFSITFVRNGTIYIIRNLSKYEDYDFVVSHYNLNDNDTVILYFNAYTELDLGKMPVVISNNSACLSKKEEIKTSFPVLFLSEDIAGLEDKKEHDFIKHLIRFNRNKNKEIMNLVFGDNQAVILNTNGNVEIYGLEFSSKKWEKDSKGRIFSSSSYKQQYSYNNYNYYNGCGYEYDDGYNGYNNYYNKNNHTNSNSTYNYNKQKSNDFDEFEDYCYMDSNASLYTCDNCHTRVSSLFGFNGQLLCKNCISEQKKKSNAICLKK